MATIAKLVRIAGWLIIALGVAISLVALWAIGYSLLVPDASGSPDARGMLMGSGIFSLLIGGVPTFVVGVGVLAVGRHLLSRYGAPPNDSSKPTPL
uniref:hypothetical protein n=1 Tax=Cognatilysobacter terrigena TaxID=2488749 RepID=UPI00105F4EE7